jgi:hypothetical protein
MDGELDTASAFETQITGLLERLQPAPTPGWAAEAARRISAQFEGKFEPPPADAPAAA